MREEFVFVFGGPVLDRSNENKIQLVGFRFNSKTTVLVKNDIITLENSHEEKSIDKVKLIGL
jgi:hypothetical protein